jgi:hypothetical protein
MRGPCALRCCGRGCHAPLDVAPDPAARVAGCGPFLVDPAVPRHPPPTFQKRPERNVRELPETSRNFRELPGTSGNFRKRPGTSRKRPEAVESVPFPRRRRVRQWAKSRRARCIVRALVRAALVGEAGRTRVVPRLEAHAAVAGKNAAMQRSTERVQPSCDSTHGAAPGAACSMHCAHRHGACKQMRRE